jgi:hypothetical protein
MEQDTLDYDMLDRLIRGGTASDTACEQAAGALEEIAHGKRELCAVRHPLGFLCLPLLREGTRGVCVHLYEEDRGPGPAGSQMHAHSWELRSLVLYGRLTNRPVVVTDRPDVPTHRVFEVRSDPGGVDELLPTPRLVRGEPGPGQTSARGDAYSMPAGQFHTTVVEQGEPTATLVLGMSLPGHTDLSLGPLHGRGHVTVRQLCEPAHTRTTVRTALRRIHAEQRERSRPRTLRP